MVQAQETAALTTTTGRLRCMPGKASNEQPNHERMNVAYFQNFDRVMQTLLDEGFTAHIFLKVYNKHVNWPAKYSAWR